MPELLSPAGDMESLYQAIHNGADAIYVGLKQFGARHYAKNFSLEEMKQAIKLCHLYGVKLYATMNTLIKDDEVSVFLSNIEFLHKEGIDAVIMQDFGMICLVREMFPNLEIHASTQANSSSIETIELFSKLGVARVVLPREMSLDEINKISVDIEKEVFIHGALCISYSGLCYMSSMLGARSGNRGECVGSCRLKYDLLKDGKILIKDQYLLSTKELNTSTRFQDLLNGNITSFKIEGRMKSPEYVGFITRFYRKLIDNEPFNLEEEIKKLKVLFNRDFTTGHLFKSKKMMNQYSPNHLGVEIGKVIEVSKKWIKIKLSQELNQEDGIRFLESNQGFIVNYLYDINKKLISSSSDIVMLDNKINLKTKDHVYKTIDKKLIKELRILPTKKMGIKLFLTAKMNQRLKLKAQSDSYIIEKKMGVVSRAKTSCITKERISKQLSKLGNTPFYCSKLEIDMDSDIFISIKELNELRRCVIEELIKVRQERKVEFVKKEICFPKIKTTPQEYLSADVITKEQLDTCLSLGFKNIYVCDLSLYQEYKHKKEVFYHLDPDLFSIKFHLQERNLVSSNILFSNYPNTTADYFLNITNIYSAYYLLKNGLRIVPVSIELNPKEILKMVNRFKEKFLCTLPLEVVIYGRVCNMVIKKNILSLDYGAKYQLRDNKKRYFPVFFRQGKTYILNHIPNYYDGNFPFSFVKKFCFYEEKKEDIIHIVNKLK